MHAKRIAWTVGVAILGSCAQAWAADDASGEAGIVWRCWWDQAVHVSCTIEHLAAVRAVEAPAPGLPDFVATLRARPQALRQRFVHIPLHTHPFQMENVSGLAQAVMCGGLKDCRVHFSANLPQAAELDRLTDPLLASDG